MSNHRRLTFSQYRIERCHVTSSVSAEVPMWCWIALALLVFPSSFSLAQSAAAPSAQPAVLRRTITVNPAQVWAEWEGWGSSLSWWAHAVGGSGNANTFADLLYTIGDVTVGDNRYPGLGLNIVRY